MRLIDGRRWTGPSIASKTLFDKERPFPIPFTSSMTEWMFGTELWQRHDKMSTPVPDGVVWDSLAVPSCDDIRGPLCHKSMRKATGIDDLPLRVVSRLSDDCLAALGEFIGCIERPRLWPPLLHVLVRVPKPTRGHRLIALLHRFTQSQCAPYGRVQGCCRQQENTNSTATQVQEKNFGISRHCVTHVVNRFFRSSQEGHSRVI